MAPDGGGELALGVAPRFRHMSTFTAIESSTQTNIRWTG